MVFLGFFLCHAGYSFGHSMCGRLVLHSASTPRVLGGFHTGVVDELNDTDLDLIFAGRTRPAPKRENGPGAVYPSKRLTHTLLLVRQRMHICQFKDISGRPKSYTAFVLRLA